MMPQFFSTLPAEVFLVFCGMIPFFFTLLSGLVFNNAVLGEVFFIFAPSFLFMRRYAFWKKAEKISKKSLLFFLFLAVIFSLLFNFTLPFITEILPVSKDMRFLFEWELSEGFFGFLTTLIYLVLIPAICEEFFYRGVLAAGLKVFLPMRLAHLFAAFIFAGIHLNPWIFFQLMAVALLCSWAMEKQKSLFAAVAVHATNNLVSVLLAYAGVLPDIKFS